MQLGKWERERRGRGEDHVCEASPYGTLFSDVKQCERTNVQQILPVTSQPQDCSMWNSNVVKYLELQGHFLIRYLSMYNYGWVGGNISKCAQTIMLIGLSPNKIKTFPYKIFLPDDSKRWHQVNHFVRVQKLVKQKFQFFNFTKLTSLKWKKFLEEIVVIFKHEMCIL